MDHWTQVDIYTTSAGIEAVGALVLELGVGGYTVQDPEDFEAFLQGKHGHWDYIDDELMKLRNGKTVLTVYLAQNAQGAEQLIALKSGLERLRNMDSENEWGALEYTLSGVKEEDWATAWKQYYKPSAVGDKLVICPSWEEYTPKDGQVVIRLDPGMAFGTGSHNSTRMCLQLLQGFPPTEVSRVMDVGCGSGILAVSALLLGAQSAHLMDIDETAVKVAKENAQLNGVAERCTFLCSGNPCDLQGQYDIVFANIVADIIIAFLPDLKRILKPDGVLITSGIIDTRKQDVLDALAAAHLTVTQSVEAEGWVALACAHLKEA